MEFPAKDILLRSDGGENMGIQSKVAEKEPDITEYERGFGYDEEEYEYIDLKICGVNGFINETDNIELSAIEIDDKIVDFIPFSVSASSLACLNMPYIIPGLNSLYISTSSVDNDAKEKLKKDLKVISERDMSLYQKGKDCFYNDSETLEKVFSLDSNIENASKKYNVDKAMIQAILYREIRCYGLDDPLADKWVKKGYAYKHQFDEYIINRAILNVRPIIPVPYRLDSSTGAGQIFAETAIDAYNLYYGTNYDSEHWVDLEMFWNNLQDEDYNVDMVALVLRLKAYKCGFDINCLSDEQRKLVFKGYNGTGDVATAYGETVHDYYSLFNCYNNNETEQRKIGGI